MRPQTTLLPVGLGTAVTAARRAWLVHPDDHVYGYREERIRHGDYHGAARNFFVEQVRTQPEKIRLDGGAFSEG